MYSSIVYVSNFILYIFVAKEFVREHRARALRTNVLGKRMDELSNFTVQQLTVCSMLFANGRLVCDEIEYCTEPWSHGVVNFSNKLAIVFVFGQSSFVRLAVHLLG